MRTQREVPSGITPTESTAQCGPRSPSAGALPGRAEDPTSRDRLPSSNSTNHEVPRSEEFLGGEGEVRQPTCPSHRQQEAPQRQARRPPTPGAPARVPFAERPADGSPHSTSSHTLPGLPHCLARAAAPRSPRASPSSLPAALPSPQLHAPKHLFAPGLRWLPASSAEARPRHAGQTPPSTASSCLPRASRVGNEASASED